MKLLRSLICWLRHGGRGLSRFRLSYIKTVQGRTAYIKTCIFCETEKMVGTSEKVVGR